MLGAIVGDVVGSRFERHPTKSKDFELFTQDSRFTDDTVLTCAVAWALMHGESYAAHLRLFGRQYPRAGYGGRFKRWLFDMQAPGYASWGNGSAMRVSPVGWLCRDMDTVLQQAAASARPTHGHPEGVRGARAVAGAVFLARTGRSKDEIRDFLQHSIGYDMQRSLDDLRPSYAFDVSCAGSVPEAMLCFLESESFEDALRNAVSLGGDSDTQACMAGAVAEAWYGGVPEDIARETRARLDRNLLVVLQQWQEATALRG